MDNRKGWGEKKYEWRMKKIKEMQCKRVNATEKMEGMQKPPANGQTELKLKKKHMNENVFFFSIQICWEVQGHQFNVYPRWWVKACSLLCT